MQNSSVSSSVAGIRQAYLRAENRGILPFIRDASNCYTHRRLGMFPAPGVWRMETCAGHAGMRGRAYVSIGFTHRETLDFGCDLGSNAAHCACDIPDLFPG